MKQIKITLGDYSRYEIFKYPAGEMQVRLKPETVKEVQTLNAEDVLIVLLRINTTERLLEASHLINAISGVRSTKCKLSVQVPYLPYGRADRRFTPGDCLGIDITSIGLLGQLPWYADVASFDIHNKEAATGVNVNITPELESVIKNFAKGRSTNTVNVLFPDKGAADRYALPNHYENNVTALKLNKVYCQKQRDPATGKLAGFVVPELVYDNTIVIDDICDGGGTFIGIAESLGLHPKGLGDSLALYVSHGIFSKGLEELTRFYDKIYTTDSFYSYEEYVEKFNSYIRAGQLEVERMFF